MIHDAMNRTMAELERACEKFSDWPTDPAHALSIVAEEFGELAREINQLCYESNDESGFELVQRYERVQKEAVQLAAMSIRMLAGIHKYEYIAAEQVEQTL